MAKRLLIIVMCLHLFFAGVACTASDSLSIESDTEQISLRVYEALERGDYRTAVDISRTFSDKGDPDAIFTTGMLMLEWLEDPSAVDRPTFDVDEALGYIREAASLGVVQAAGALRSGHEFGRYSLPIDEIKAKCWRSVELGERTAADCD